MAIETIGDHTIDTFVQQVRCCNDALRRIGDNLDPRIWDQGDVQYLLDQLDHARRWIFRAHAVALAQQTATSRRDGFPQEVRAEV